METLLKRKNVLSSRLASLSVRPR